MLFKDKIESSFRDMSALGSHTILFPLILFIYLIGLKYLTLQLIIGIFLSYIINFIIRIFYFKNRPVKERYNSFLSKIDSSSFPSAHSSRVIIFAIILSSYFNNLYLSFLFIISALFVAYSRIRTKKHFIFDVIVGLFIGIIISFFVLRFL